MKSILPLMCVAVIVGLLVSPLAAQEVRRVEFVTTDSDGVRIVADYYSVPAEGNEKPPVVILLHMYKSDRSAWQPLATVLQERGVACLALDSRGHGESIQPESADLVARVDRRQKRVFTDMVRDIEAAYLWLTQNAEVDLARFGLVGASIGGTIALKYATKDVSVDVVVAMSPGLRYMKIDSLKDMEKTKERDVYLVGEERDRANIMKLKQAHPKADVEVVTPADPNENIHGTRMLGQVRGLESKIAGYLKRKLGTHSDEVVVAKYKGKVYYPAGSERAEKVDPEKRRLFSTVKEAEERGLREVGKAPTGGSMGQLPI